jgi:hypothetical protein
LLVFEQRKPGRLIPLRPDDVSAEVRLRDGKVRREEFHYGESYLSQSGRWLEWGDGVVSVEIANEKGEKRSIK